MIIKYKYSLLNNLAVTFLVNEGSKEGLEEVRARSSHGVAVSHGHWQCNNSVDGRFMKNIRPLTS